MILTDTTGRFFFDAPLQDAVYAKILNSTFCVQNNIVAARNRTLTFIETPGFHVTSNVGFEASMIDQNEPKRR